jgi:hypothetical protein
VVDTDEAGADGVDTMKANEYKDRYVHPTPPFWETKNLLHTPEIPVTLHTLLAATVQRLNRIYLPFAWMWMRMKKPLIYKHVSEIEECINIAIQGDNEEMLHEMLDQYYEAWVMIIDQYKKVADTFTPF